MKCPKCTFDIPDDMKFCVECGHKLEIICPECSFANAPSFKFCGECGHDLQKPQETVPIDRSKPKSYTPKHLQDKILTTRSSLEGERKIVTVLFADVANYTSMSEKLDPEEVLQIMDGAFKIMMDETHKYEGTINQFTGDGIMAIFGAPVAHENHAQRACYTALSIQKAMTDYSVKIEKEYGLEFKIRIGINSGPVIVSAIGDDLRMDYTAVGDTTNLASRMEDQANPGSIFVSANTYKIAERYFDFTHVGKTEVKGKEEPQDIYELIKTSEVVTRIDESVAKGLTRFVGRKNSMAILIESYDQVKSGIGQVVGIVGEAGVGKSRLILEFRNCIANESHTWLEGQCLQYGGSILYKPILDVLKTLFEIKDTDREHAIKKKIQDKLPLALENAIPSFQDLLSVPVDDEAFLKLEPKQKRDRAFEAIRDLLISISQAKPLILTVEDLHWIDDSSEEFLNYLIEWIANTPIMLILLYRTEYQHKWGSKTYYHKIGLDHLGKDSAIELVYAMLKDGDVAQELQDLILGRAAGNPLFMEEFTRTLIENGTIEKQNSHYVLSQKISDLQVPDTVQGIIAARMDRLEENLKRTMQVASVIGRDFAFRILQTITGMREELKSYLLNLQGLEFIYEKRLFPELEYIFKHALTQEVAYNSLLLKRRKQIHETIGKAIEEIYSDRLEEFYEMLAYHYSKSDRAEKAVQYLESSGGKASRNYANQDAYNFFKEALGLLNRLPDTVANKKKKIEIYGLMIRPMWLLGYPEESLGFLLNGEKLSKEIKDTKSLASFCHIIGAYFLFKGKPEEAKNYVEERFYEAQKDEDIDLMASLAIQICESLQVSGYYYKTIDILEHIITLLEKNNKQYEYFVSPLTVYSHLCNLYGASLSYTGHFEKAKLFLEKGIAPAIKNNDKFNIGQYYSIYCLLYRSKGDGKNVIEQSQNSFKYFEEINFQFHIAMSWYHSGWGYYLIGDLDTAKKNLEKGYAMQKEISVAYNISLYPWLLGWVYSDLGDITSAKSYAEEALELAVKGNSRHIEGLSRICLGSILGKGNSSKTEEAEKYISQGITILEEIKLRPYIVCGYFFLGQLYANARRKDEAWENLTKALSMCQEMGIEYWPDKIQEVLDRL